MAGSIIQRCYTPFNLCAFLPRSTWKQFDCEVGEGICTDMGAIRKDYFLDHDHSAYVDRWDWERVITADMRNLDFLREIVEKIWTVIYEAGQMVRKAGILSRRGDPRTLPRPSTQTA